MGSNMIFMLLIINAFLRFLPINSNFNPSMNPLTTEIIENTQIFDLFKLFVREYSTIPHQLPLTIWNNTFDALIDQTIKGNNGPILFSESNTAHPLLQLLNQIKDSGNELVNAFIYSQITINQVLELLFRLLSNKHRISGESATLNSLSNMPNNVEYYNDWKEMISKRFSDLYKLRLVTYKIVNLRMNWVRVISDDQIESTSFKDLFSQLIANYPHETLRTLWIWMFNDLLEYVHQYKNEKLQKQLKSMQMNGMYLAGNISNDPKSSLNRILDDHSMTALLIRYGIGYITDHDFIRWLYDQESSTDEPTAKRSRPNP
eukprot:NODE_617_length_5364_cov_0.787654.p2 type:complete len:317 gc:universal NODE_617_length_5364_cov_0.787654:2550-1600(-)